MTNDSGKGLDHGQAKNERSQDLARYSGLRPIQSGTLNTMALAMVPNAARADTDARRGGPEKYWIASGLA